jgi:hypothetical protein
MDAQPKFKDAGKIGNTTVRDGKATVTVTLPNHKKDCNKELSEKWSKMFYHTTSFLYHTKKIPITHGIYHIQF